MDKKPKQSSRYRQLLRAEQSLLKVVPLIRKAHEITRQHQRKVGGVDINKNKEN